jgi:hypothetical protein
MTADGARLGVSPMTPVGKLNDCQIGWLVTAGIFGWIRTRCEQAIEEGLDPEQALRRKRQCDLVCVRNCTTASRLAWCSAAWASAMPGLASATAQAKAIRADALGIL